MSYDQDHGAGTLRWKPNPVGRQPAKYRVYGSDEKGFSVSDVPYKVNVGVSKELPSQFPANFIAETAATELAVIGSQVDLPNATKTYYRVVAVDQQGKRSGPSDYATAPRPIIYSKPVLTAKVGAEYRYQVLANRCLGDLRVNGETPPASGTSRSPSSRLSGDRSGSRSIRLPACSRARPMPPARPRSWSPPPSTAKVRKLDEASTQVGQREDRLHHDRRVGEASQPFVIEVTPSGYSLPSGRRS